MTDKPAQEQKRPHPFGERFSWVQFWCGFVISGFAAFLHVDPVFDGLWIHLLKTLTFAAVCGTLAGRFGDAAWRWILRVARWV